MPKRTEQGASSPIYSTQPKYARKKSNQSGRNSNRPKPVAKRFNTVEIINNNRWQPISPDSPAFSRIDKNTPKVTKPHPVNAPKPSKNPWRRKQKVKVYHDSHLHRTKELVNEKLRLVGTLLNDQVEFDVEYSAVFSVAALHYLIKHEKDPKKRKSHKDTKVLIHLGTNDLKRKVESPHDPRSKRNIPRLLHETIKLLKEETEDITILSTPPAKKFNVAPYNDAVLEICQAEDIHFAYGLVARHNIIDRDGIHVDFQFSDLVPKSVAAALFKVDPFTIFDHPCPFGNYLL